MSVPVDEFVPRPRHRVVFNTVGDSRTDPSFRQECDISSIVARFTRTGVLPQGRMNGQYADVSGLGGDRAELVSRAAETMSQVNDRLRLRQEEAAKAAAAEKAADDALVKKRRRTRQIDAFLEAESPPRPVKP